MLVCQTKTCQQNTNSKQRAYLQKKLTLFRGYLAFYDFSGRFFEERRPGREKVLFGVLLQATVATAHRAIPRHLRRKTLDSNSAASKPPKLNSC